MGLGLLARRGSRPTSPSLVEAELGLLASRPSAPRCARARRASAAAAARAQRQRLAPTARAARSSPAKMRSTPLVVQARVGADQRAVEGAAAHAPRRSSSSSTVTASRSAPGISEQASLESACGSIGSTAPGHVHARRAPAPRLAVERAALAHVGADVGDVHPDPARAVRRAPRPRSRRRSRGRSAGSIVKVGSARRSRRSPARARGRPRRLRAPRARRPSAKPRRRPRSSISASITSRATSGRPMHAHDARPRAPRPRAWTSTRSPASRPPPPAAGGPPTTLRAEPPRRPGVRAGVLARGEQPLGGEEAPAPLEHRHVRRRSARGGPRAAVARPAAGAGRSPDFGGERVQRHLQPVGRCRRRSGRALRGSRPAPCLTPPPPRLRPFGREVLADGDVERAAVGELLLLLEDALAEGVACRRRSRGGGPAGRRSRSPPPRRCSASTSTTTGIAVGIAPPVAISVWRRLGAPARGDDHAAGDEDARDQLRLLDQPAAVAAQVEHDPAGAFVQHLFDRFARLPRGRPGVNGASATTPELLAVDGVASRDATTGSETIARVILTCARRARAGVGAGGPLRSRAPRRCPGRPLISGHRLSRGEPRAAGAR